ncbi:hypothetical protein [Desulfurobacterium atlanticum]|uniref:ATP synthase I chain n=1 Tax=Desulfurobacterium atlanticum TaxID=240169 RepID=A0A238ZRH9_9BACT|nr:hypothetical protein [Desulfurobacterium atlanticum]SNR86056.1 hypothetical protein SAMN06265340_11130 [Desulfurobacterium atlanticum]
MTEKNFELKVLKILAMVSFFGVVPFGIYSKLSVAKILWFIYGTSVIYLDYIFLARFSSQWRKKIIQGNKGTGGSFILKYFVIIPLLYAGIRVAPQHIFAIISGAVWATFAFIITTIIILKERSGWNTEEHQDSSHGQ